MNEPVTIKGKTKYFEYTVFPDQAYIYIKILPSLKPSGGELKVIPLSDIHIGAKGFQAKRFDDLLDYIASEPVLCYLNGDTMEIALPDSPSGVFEQTMNPNEQGKYLREKLKKIKDKILFAQPGNHEQRMIKRTSYDPLEWVLLSLDDGYTRNRYFSYPIYATIEYCGHKFNFFVQHGSSGSATPGGKINAASKPMKFIKDVNFMLMGHVHSSSQAPQTKFEIKMEGGKMMVREYLVYVIVSPAFYEYFKSYAAIKGYPPPSTGVVVPYLQKNGSYGASS